MAKLPALTSDTIWDILHDVLDDDTVNRLVWQGLGYRYSDPENDTEPAWDTTAVAAEWRDEYPEPPNFIDSRPATVKLTRSIPKADKQLLKEELGFGGYTVSELVPRKTRRATMANWLLSYLKQHNQ